MTILRYLACAGFAIALSACQGGFGGTSTPGSVTPPVNVPAQGALNQATPTPIASAAAKSAAASAAPATYPFAKSGDGLACPQMNGYTCKLYLNEPAPSPAPSGANAKVAAHGASASPSPSPSPTPSPTPSPAPSGSGVPSAGPSASPTPSGPQITLSLDAPPKNAPAMINPDAKALATEPLLALRVRTDSNVSIAGHATAIFTLPKSQIGGRGFAIQLFHESIGKHDKHTDTYFGSYAKSTMKDDTLRFELSLPPITVKKDEIWLFVLYGDEQPELSPSPATSGSPAASSSPMANGSSAASASPVPSPT